MAQKMEGMNGEVAVTIIRTKRNGYLEQHIDFTDYTNPRITAVIPCWKDSEGRLTSVKTGKPVIMKEGDEQRVILRGMSFHYPDGEEILLTRDGRGKIFFVPREYKASVPHRAFGE